MTGLIKDDLKKIAERENKALSAYKAMLMVCTGTGCVSAKGFDILEKLKKLLKEKNLDKAVESIQKAKEIYTTKELLALEANIEKELKERGTKKK